MSKKKTKKRKIRTRSRLGTVAAVEAAIAAPRRKRRVSKSATAVASVGGVQLTIESKRSRDGSAQTSITATL